MSDERGTKGQRSPAWRSSEFWDGVEREVDALDADEFAEFLVADSLELPLRPGFRDELRSRLGDLVRQRFGD